MKVENQETKKGTTNQPIDLEPDADQDHDSDDETVGAAETKALLSHSEQYKSDNEGQPLLRGSER